MRIGPTVIEPDGTRVYTYIDNRGWPQRKRYKPVPKEQRKYQGPKYNGERGMYHRSRWVPELTEVLPDEDRVMPETIPDYYITLHKFGCECTICQRPHALYWKRLKYRTPKLSSEELDRQPGPYRSARRPRSAGTEA